MTKHDDRKDQIRTRMERTGEKYTVAKRALETRPRLMLPLCEPVPAATACPACEGSGCDGTAVEFAEPESNAVLVCPVLCLKCRGCGWADHSGCRPEQHDDPEEFGYDPYEDGLNGGEDRCYSCRGRRSWIMQAFDAEQVYSVRVPCGCATKLLVAAP